MGDIDRGNSRRPARSGYDAIVELAQQQEGQEVTASTIVLMITTGIAIIGAIGSVLLLAFRIGTLVGTNAAFMAASEGDRASLRADLTRLADRFSLHVEHHGKTAP
jgi:hypothetical protein